ncbi:mobilization protein [Tannerella serpentiformis]|uniref:relaxase/mobilization nuclease domain-containing protein n=1 Tax=Tannerella serpentiformis TaxID=712710 RepID=UPI000840AAD9|nr:relaxase/mobilization nuclease domain-containing protein [Tannerella serpentiformis]AOH41020.1 mobilization protein [Tannerella serpentiformis]AVV52726.1 mobilization protein [Tannerella serpentiformis]
MIAKCKAIAHGSNALEYVFREGKLGRILALHNLCGETPKEIHEEMRLINNYNSRCKNKFLRIEIGIAPKDEPLMTFKTLNRLALLFAKQMGLDDHQWVAVTHKDTDNLHIHIIANRISLGGQVYDTTFVSNRAARVAENLIHKYGLTIANEVHSARPHRKVQADPARERTKQQVRNICYALLEKHKRKGLSGHSVFLYELHQSGVTIDRMKNKQGKVYGLKFTYGDHSFKASEIGREFGYRTLPKQFESGNAQKPIIQSSHSSMRSTNDSTPIAQVAVSTVDTALDTAGSLLSEVGEVTTLQTHGADYAEIAWQRRLRNQAVKKKRRGRGI